eukprot:421838_1
MGNNLFASNREVREPCLNPDPFIPFVPTIQLSGLAVSGYIHRIEPLLKNHTPHSIPSGVYQLCVDFYFVSKPIFLHFSSNKSNKTMFAAVDFQNQRISKHIIVHDCVSA